MKPLRLLAFLVVASFHAEAWAIPRCAQDADSLKPGEKLECLQIAGTASASARKRLAHRLRVFMDKAARSAADVEVVAEARAALDALARQEDAAAKAYLELKEWPSAAAKTTPDSELGGVLDAQASVLAEADKLIARLDGSATAATLVQDGQAGKAFYAHRAARSTYMNFLYRHPLLNSEVSRSGIQFSSTAGDGMVTLKQVFGAGTDGASRLALTASVPIDKDAEDHVWRAKNNAFLNRLGGDATMNIAYTSPRIVEESRQDRFELSGASAELGYQKFSYFDAATAFVTPDAPVKSDKKNVSTMVSGYWGFTHSLDRLYLFRFSWLKEKEGQKSFTICPAVAGDGASFVKCQNGALGAPTSSRHGVISFEARRMYQDFAWTAVVSYDHVSKVKALAIPLHFSSFNRSRTAVGDDSKFSAGVILGWRSDTRGSFGFFAGVPFSLTEVD
ncbi:MAG: hypothetical protein ACRYGO_06175 [Janthinobacterium lividum]